MDRTHAERSIVRSAIASGKATRAKYKQQGPTHATKIFVTNPIKGDAEEKNNQEEGGRKSATNEGIQAIVDSEKNKVAPNENQRGKHESITGRSNR